MKLTTLAAFVTLAFAMVQDSQAFWNPTEQEDRLMIQTESSFAAGLPYEQAGEFKVRKFPAVKFTMPKSTECGSHCKIRLYVNAPIMDLPNERLQDFIGRSFSSSLPLAVFSPGFTQPFKGAYEIYAERLASYGYVVVGWEPESESALSSGTHFSRGLMAKYVTDWVISNANSYLSSEFDGLVDVNADSMAQYLRLVDVNMGVVQMGHSVGGKTAVIAAEQDSRVRAVIAIDPVDCAPPLKSVNRDYPLSHERLSLTKAFSVFIGTDLSRKGTQACAPESCDYSTFFDSVPRSMSAWSAQILNAGHLQFLEKVSGINVCKAGNQKNQVIQGITSTMMVAAAEHAIRDADISPYIRWTEELVQSRVLGQSGFKQASM